MANHFVWLHAAEYPYAHARTFNQTSAICIIPFLDLQLSSRGLHHLENANPAKSNPP
jgi:hypothetical protein